MSLEVRSFELKTCQVDYLELSAGVVGTKLEMAGESKANLKLIESN